MEGTLLQALESNLKGKIDSLADAAKSVMQEAHTQIKAAELVGDGVTAKAMLARHTRAARVLNAMKGLEAAQ